MPQDDNPAALLKHREGVSLRCVFVVHVTAPAALDTLSLHDALPIFVNAALGQESQSEYYLAAEGRMLGNDEFLHEVKHRIGDYALSRDKPVRKADMEGIVKAAEKATGLERKDLCSNSKNRQLVLVK